MGFRSHSFGPVCGMGSAPRGYATTSYAPRKCPAVLFGQTVETVETFQTAIDDGEFEEGEPAYIEEDEVWAVNYGGTAVKLQYPSLSDYQTAIDTYDIPDGVTTWIDDGEGGGSQATNEGGEATPTNTGVGGVCAPGAPGRAFSMGSEPVDATAVDLEAEVIETSNTSTV